MNESRELSFGDIVYLKTDPEQKPRMVTGIMNRPTAKVFYLSIGDSESSHYEIEISKTKDIIFALTN